MCITNPESCKLLAATNYLEKVSLFLDCSTLGHLAIKSKIIKEVIQETQSFLRSLISVVYVRVTSCRKSRQGRLVRDMLAETAAGVWPS